jgi:hypothetical protein
MRVKKIQKETLSLFDEVLDVSQKLFNEMATGEETSAVRTRINHARFSAVTDAERGHAPLSEDEVSGLKKKLEGTRRLTSLSSYGDRPETEDPLIGAHSVTRPEVVDVVMNVVDRALQNNGLKKATDRTNPENYAPGEFRSESVVWWVGKKEEKDQTPVIGNLSVTARIEKDTLRKIFADATRSLPVLVGSVIEERAREAAPPPAMPSSR